MEMSIDEAIEYNKNLKMYMEINDKLDEYKFLEENHIALDMAVETMRKYQKLQADYENRLKADMVAMLEEIQLEVDELEPMYMDMISPRQVYEIFQQKINALKAESEVEE